MRFSRFSHIFAAAVALLLLTASCHRQQAVPRAAVEYVNSLLSDREGRDYNIVASYDSLRVDGPIFIVGEPERCLGASEAFITSDRFDNVTGSRCPDGLPDFCGETVMALLDKANAPYDGYLHASNSAFLRELAVRHTVSGLDTVSFVSPFDKEGMGRRSPAKMIVLVSPYMAAYGRFDADTLFTCLGLPSPVVSPVFLMFSECMERNSGNATVGLIADSSAIADRVYELVFDECRARAADGGSATLFQRSASGTGAVLAAFLDAYGASDSATPLTALVVDDFRVDLDSLRRELAAIRVELSDEALRYGKLLSPDFKILDTRSTMTGHCYESLRKSNKFTHNIAYPKADALISSPSTELPAPCYAEDGSFSREFKYSRVPASNLPSYMLLQFNLRFLPECLQEELLSNAPKTYSAYVQK